MSNITIALSENELKLLLKHVVLANWMLESHKSEADDEGRVNEAFYHKILSLADENGVDEGIVFDEDLKNFFLTEKKEEEYHGYIDSYDEDVFWDMLEDELASRDFFEKHGEKAISDMDAKKRFILLEREGEKYYREFVKHGVKNLKIVK